MQTVLNAIRLASMVGNVVIATIMTYDFVNSMLVKNACTTTGDAPDSGDLQVNNK